MKLRTRVLLLISALFAGCETTHDVVSTSFHVVTAPVRFVHHHLWGDHEEPPPPPAASEPVATSDVVTTPGQPVPVATPPPPRRSVASTRTRSKPSPSPRPRTSSSRAASGQAEFPTAKPVPGRPGLVYNPFDPNGGYIDVSGYTPGSKVKDPDSQKIFIVP